MTSVRRMIAELDAVITHARRSSRALHELPADRVIARFELMFILEAMPQLRAMYEELGRSLPPQIPPAA